MLRQVQELVVGNGAPEKERQPRRELDIVDAVRGAGDGVPRILLHPKQEFGSDQKCLKGVLDGAVEIAACAGPLIKRVERLSIDTGDGASERAVGETGQDRARAR